MSARKMLVTAAAALALCWPTAAPAWQFVQDRLNNPDYQGTSGLVGEATATQVHIWGTNTGSPQDEFHGSNLWCGLAAESETRFDAVAVSATGVLNGTGYGFIKGIALWQDINRYIIYGLECDGTNGYPYYPSRWVASGQLPSWPFPAWTPLVGPIPSPNGPHDYRVEYDGQTVRFWFDGALLNTYAYQMEDPSVRLVAYARSYGDTVDALFTDVSVTGSPTPEPSLVLIGAARQLPSYSYVRVNDAVVTAPTLLPGSVFVESSDRTAGIRLLTNQSLDVGQRV